MRPPSIICERDEHGRRVDVYVRSNDVNGRTTYDVVITDLVGPEHTFTMRRPPHSGSRLLLARTLRRLADELEEGG